MANKMIPRQSGEFQSVEQLRHWIAFFVILVFLLIPSLAGAGLKKITLEMLENKGTQTLAEQASQHALESFLSSLHFQKIQQDRPESTYVANTHLARIRIHVSMGDLFSIVESGSIQNQHQTGSSFQVESYDPERRRQIEAELLGVSFSRGIEKNPKFKAFLPKYGAVEFPDFASNKRMQEDWIGHVIKSDEIIAQYGEVSLYLKNSVKKRATFTAIDSANSRAGQAQSFRQKSLYLYADDIAPGEYFEAQIWGELKLKDIDYVVMHEGDLSEEIFKILKKVNIPIRLEKNSSEITAQEKVMEELRVKAVHDRPVTADRFKKAPMDKTRLKEIDKNFEDYANNEKDFKQLIVLAKSDPEFLQFFIQKFNHTPISYNEEFLFKLADVIFEKGEEERIKNKMIALLIESFDSSSPPDKAFSYLIKLQPENEKLIGLILARLAKDDYQITNRALATSAFQALKINNSGHIKKLAKAIRDDIYFRQIDLLLALASPNCRLPEIQKALVSLIDKAQGREYMDRLAIGLKTWVQIPEAIPASLKRFESEQIHNPYEKQKVSNLLRSIKGRTLPKAMRCDHIFR